MKSMAIAKIEGVVKVSSKGQIVIPKEVREKLGVNAGEKLLVIRRDGEILLKKMGLSVEEIGERVEKAAREKGIDVDKLISEACEWARKSE
jgi:antitoxin PrlF